MLQIPLHSYRTLLVFLILLGVKSTFAQNFDENDTYFNHLQTVNGQWEKYETVSPKGSIDFDSDADRIQLHLRLVSNYLKESSPSKLNEEQLAKRSSLLDALAGYAEDKVFPNNKYHLTRRPYFIDEEDVYCAVGYLISYSGHDELARKISAEHNYDYVADIKTEGLLAWADTHGFSVNELKWIQPGYPPTVTLDSLSNGTNGTVRELYADNSAGRMLFAGDFSTVDNLPCLNIGYWQNNQLSCLGGGITGVVNEIASNQNDVYVFGALEYNGDVYPVAMYDGTNWSYINIPNREGAVCTAALGLASTMEVSISHSSIPGQQEIWLFDGTWERQALVNGIVLDVNLSPYGKIFAGRFDSVNYFFPGVDTTILANNFVVKEYSVDNWYSVSGEISDTVNVIKTVGSTVYFGGTSSWITGNPVCVARLLNNTLQPVITAGYFADTAVSINSIEYANTGSDLVIGGNFTITPMVGTYGKNLAKYNLVLNSMYALAFLDEPVHDIVLYDDELYAGGVFQTNLYSQNLNHLLRFSPLAGVDEAAQSDEVRISPNPFTDEIHIEGATAGTYYTIMNVAGQVLRQGKLENESISGLHDLPKGSYVIRLASNGSFTTHKLMK